MQLYNTIKMVQYQIIVTVWCLWSSRDGGE